MHMHTLVKHHHVSLSVFLFGVRMGVLHSDGEMMTMAHYPLPEEWI